MRLLSKFRLRRSASEVRRSDRAVIRLRRREQFERSHEYRKLDITEANKNGMGFNGL